MSDHTPFLTVFPGCTDLMSLAGGLEKAFITDVQIDLRERSMNVSARFLHFDLRQLQFRTHGRGGFPGHAPHGQAVRPVG